MCARCRTQVLLCSRCDRGQRFCGRACSRAARLESRRAAARRYQRSRAGRMTHAARSRRWRQRRRERQQRTCGEAAALDGGVIDFVTHQGSPTPAEDAPLTFGVDLAAAVDGGVPLPSVMRCRRCGAPLSRWVRQGFLRHGMRRWPARVIAPSP
ncbi:MAG: hypothetical protein MUF16_15530 [Burkholderiaceae bacterium]|nr:hypothetical protein [Burkholderiaceae bacterium]